MIKGGCYLKTISYLEKELEYYDYYLSDSSCTFTFFNTDDADINNFFGEDIINSVTLINDDTKTEENISLGMKYKSSHKEFGSIKKINYEVVTQSYYSEEPAIDINTGGQLIDDGGTPMIRVIFHPAEIKTNVENVDGMITTVYLEKPNVYDRIDNVSNTIQQMPILTSIARIAAQSFTDSQALSVKEVYPTYDDLVKTNYCAESIGYKFAYNGDLYKTAQANLTFQSHYVPGQGTESLYTRIDEKHKGSVDDPIPAFANMEYFQGKYYIENDVIYLCNSELAKDGIVLQFVPSDLVGTYFEKVESDV